MDTRSKRWVKPLVICLIGAFVVGLVWITVEDLSPLDFRTEAAWRRGYLQPQLVVYVYQGRLGRPEISVAEARAICANRPNM